MHLKLPRPFALWSMRTFAKHYNINLEEAEKSLAEYDSIGDFFTRRLKKGVRPVSHLPYVHPADSRITSRGRINADEILQAKGRTYKISEMIDDTTWQRFKGGSYLTYYLCPTDYHRVHSPVDGEIREIRYQPGNLWPVNDWSVANIDRLFAVNERVILDINSDQGPLSLVFVGATNVGSIRLAFDAKFRTNHTHHRTPKVQKLTQPIKVTRGQELGMFAMGSTVIIVAGPGYRSLQPLVESQGDLLVKVGSFQ